MALPQAIQIHWRVRKKESSDRITHIYRSPRPRSFAERHLSQRLRLPSFSLLPPSVTVGAIRNVGILFRYTDLAWVTSIEGEESKELPTRLWKSQQGRMPSYKRSGDRMHRNVRI